MGGSRWCRAARRRRNRQRARCRLYRGYPYRLPRPSTARYGSSKAAGRRRPVKTSPAARIARRPPSPGGGVAAADRPACMSCHDQPAVRVHRVETRRQAATCSASRCRAGGNRHGRCSARSPRRSGRRAGTLGVVRDHLVAGRRRHGRGLRVIGAITTRLPSSRSPSQGLHQSHQRTDLRRRRTAAHMVSRKRSEPARIAASATALLVRAVGPEFLPARKRSWKVPVGLAPGPSHVADRRLFIAGGTSIAGGRRRVPAAVDALIVVVSRHLHDHPLGTALVLVLLGHDAHRVITIPGPNRSGAGRGGGWCR